MSEEKSILNHRGKATSWHASGAFIVKVTKAGSPTAERRGERAGEKGDVHVDVARGPAGYRSSMVGQATAQRDTERNVEGRSSPGCRLEDLGLNVMGGRSQQKHMTCPYLRRGPSAAWLRGAQFLERELLSAPSLVLAAGE